MFLDEHVRNRFWLLDVEAKTLINFHITHKQNLRAVYICAKILLKVKFAYWF